MKKVLSVLLSIILIMALFPAGIFSITASAATSGYYTYTVSGGKATITSCDTSISGNVTIPSTLGGYPVTSIGDWAFVECTLIKSITIPDNVKSIGDSAFQDCQALANVILGNGLTSIGDMAFGSCINLVNITIPESVISISGYAFAFCVNLTTISVDDKNKNYSSQEGILFNKEKTVLLCYPSNKSGTTYIIPNTVTSIGNDSFNSCKNLANITIPDSVTSIGSYAFVECSGLTNITIPDSVTTIEYGAFNGCSKIKSIIIPKGIRSIGDYTFKGCTGLLSINIPNSVTSIGDYAFSECYSLVEINIPNSVISIGKGAFMGAKNITGITIPNGVTNIADDTFYNCQNLTSIIIPGSVISIGDFAFRDCKNLINVYYCGTLTQWNNIDMGYSNTYLNDAKRNYHIYDDIYDKYCNECNELREKPTGTTGDCTWTLDGTVLTISGEGDMADYYYYSQAPWGAGITEVIIEKGVTSIGDSAFHGSNITYINLPNSIISIGSSAFYGCTGLTSVDIPDSVEKLNSSAFSDCTGLKNVIIGKGVIDIAGGAFLSCSGITSITIQNSVTSIGGNAFTGCTNLKDVYYTGSKQKSETIDVVIAGNDCLINATWHYDSCIGAAEHTYDGCLDTICNICKIEREITHKWKSEHSFDDNVHWIECSVCGEKQAEPVDHIYDNTCDTSCNVCDNVREITHNWKTEHSFDDNTHWIECSVCGEKQAEPVDHIYDNTCDTSCNDCEHTRELVDIAISTSPTKLYYLQGSESFDVSGGEITLYYNDGTTDVVDITDDMVTGFDATELGEQTLTITYGGKTTTLTVYIVDTLPGDVDQNGEVDVVDLALLKKVVAGLSARIDVDLNGDGTTDVVDLALLKKMVAGLE